MIGVTEFTKEVNKNILILLSFAISKTISSAIFCMITLTMYQLYLGLAYVNKEYKSMCVVRQKKSCALNWFIFIFILDVLFLAPLCVSNEWAQLVGNSLELILSLIVFTVSNIIFCKLQKQMK